jgi:cytochrome P450 family 110
VEAQSSVVARSLPGPSEPPSEQVRRYIETPVAFWESCAREYGSVVLLDFGSLGPVVLLSDPQSIKDVFRLNPDCFECSPYNEHYRYVMGDLSILLQDGMTHRRQRRLVAPMFRLDELLSNVAALRSIVQSKIDSWSSGKPFNPRPTLHEVTFQVIVYLLLGQLTSPSSALLLSAHRQSIASQVGSWGPWRNFARLQPQIRETLAGEIRERRAHPDTPGFMTHLALSQDADGAPLSNQECEDHVFTMLVAGVDTTAISLAWALHWLCREPEVRERLTAELASTPAAESDKSVLRLPYLDAVYRETLRMYPIVPTPSGRKLIREVTVGGLTFPAGTTLVPCTYLVHRREDIYPASERFRPERFLGRRFESYEYFPFGGGVRSCVGELLAQLEFKSAIQAILERWDLETTASPPLTPVRHGTLLAPPDDSTMVVNPRRSG